MGIRYIIVVTCIYLGLFLGPAIAREGCSEESQPREALPWSSLFDEWLGRSKDNVQDLATFLMLYDSPRQDDRLCAWLAIKRLEEFPVEQVGYALPLLMSLVGEPYQPCRRIPLKPVTGENILEIYQEEDTFPADGAVMKLGPKCTPLVLEAINGYYVKYRAWQNVQDIMREKLPHLADILVAIEGRQKAEEVLFSKYDSATNDSERRRFKNAIAMVRAREGVERFAETPDEKYQQELARLEEELAARQKPPEAGEPKPASGEPIADLRDKHITAGTRSSSEWDQETPVAEAAPFPWAIVIVVAAAALALGAITSLLLTRAKKTAK